MGTTKEGDELDSVSGQFQPSSTGVSGRDGNSMMQFLELTLDCPAENIALDEALLAEAEEATTPVEYLRIWEPRCPIVVVGRGSRVDQEVDQPACFRRNVRVLRRTSGGAAVVTGPGCMMYAVVLSYQRRPALRAVSQAHRFVLETLASALRPLVPHVTIAGTSDLAVSTDGQYKFSGNSLRCRRNCFLYHGTLLYDMQLDLIEHLLKIPPRQPDYRQNRSHLNFVANVPCTAAQLHDALLAAWQPTGILADWPHRTTRRLVAEKYDHAEWNLRL